MKLVKKVALSVAMLSLSVVAQAGTKVLMQTNMGDIKIELADEKAPVTTQNFLNYVNSGYYDGLIYHRVIPGFMIQGGGFDQSFAPKNTSAAIVNEANNGLKNDRGTIAMARTSDINSATSQFFINVVDNPFLNHTGNSEQTYGYAVFGKVIDGMDVADKISMVQTTRKGPYSDVPVENVVIKSVKVISE